MPVGLTKQFIFNLFWFALHIRNSKLVQVMVVTPCIQPIVKIWVFHEIWDKVRKRFIMVNFLLREFFRGYLDESLISLKFRFLRIISLDYKLSDNHTGQPSGQLVLVITCLGGLFGINCPRAFLKILKLPEENGGNLKMFQNHKRNLSPKPPE